MNNGGNIKYTYCRYNNTLPMLLLLCSASTRVPVLFVRWPHWPNSWWCPCELRKEGSLWER